MDLNVTLRVPGLEKLVDYTASGIGSVAGSMLAPYRARQDAKAKAILSEGRAHALTTEAEAMSRAMSHFRTPDTSTQGEIAFQEQIDARLLFQEEKRQRNIEDVVHRSAEHLQDKEVPNEEPDHDWVSRFFGNVQDVSGSQMKELYARVLSGQVEHPGSFTLMSLEVLKNLDVATARLFRTLCSACISFSLDGERFMDSRVPVLNGNAGTNALSRYGLSFDQLNVLNEHRLIISNYNSRRNYQFSIVPMVDGKAAGPAVPFRFQGRYWALLVINGRAVGEEFKLNGVALTQVGMELSRIVDIEPMDRFAEDLKEALGSRNLRMVEVPDPFSGQQPTEWIAPSGQPDA